MQNTLKRTSLKQAVFLDSMTLPERVALFDLHPNAFTQNEQACSSRVAQWKHCLGIQETELLDHRLTELGIVRADLPYLLGDFSEEAGQYTQDSIWLEICEQVHQAPQLFNEGELPEATFLTRTSEIKEEQIPFEHVFATWVEVATCRLFEENPTTEQCLTDEILRKEQRGLLENLCTLARSTMLAQFNLNKIVTYSGNDYVAGIFSSTPPNDVYKKTVFDVSKNGYEHFFRSKPALARLLATRVEFWIRTLGEFVTHLHEDMHELEETFNQGNPLGKLTNAGRGVSDSHNGGRAVVVCTFDSDVKTVYKPRNMDIDKAWIQIITAFNQNLPEYLQLKSLQAIAKETHGWMQFASRKPCKDMREIENYYKRMGTLLCLIHSLQGNDFHLENVVAMGEHPVGIDLETISVPEPLTDNRGVELDLATEQISKSVLRTLLLPSVMALKGRPGVMNLGAVGIEADGEFGNKKHRRLTNINTDFQRWATVEGEIPTQKLDDQSKVELEDGSPVNPNAHLSNVAEGYEKAYHAIEKRINEWIKPDGQLSSYTNAWVRVLNRATNVYYRLLLETCNDNLLSSGLDRWIHSERFIVNTIGNSNDIDKDVRETGIALLRAEQEALLRGDVAYFLAKGDGTDYYSPDPVTNIPTQIPNAKLSISAVDAAVSQFKEMGEENLALQQKLMKASYVTAQLSAQQLLHGTSPKLDVKPTPEVAPSKEEVSDWVLRGLEELTSNAIFNDNRANWIDVNLDVQRETARPSAMSSGLYAGRGGISLLYERAFRHFKETRWLELAKAAIQTEVLYVTQAKNFNTTGTIFDLEGPTGMMSKPGFISAAWAIGRHEGHEEYKNIAKRLLVDMNSRVIERDESHDIISGSAGYMLLAMRFAKEESIPEIHATLHNLGEHLQKSVLDIDGTGWESITGNRPLNGFGHGRAGIGLALLEAGTFLQREDFRELGLEALLAEHSLRSKNAELPGWPDFRKLGTHDDVPKGPHMCAWCAGAEGIALSRAAALEFADDSFLQDDLEYAIACMRACPPKERQHLCCGESGRTEVYRSIQALRGINLESEISDSFSYHFANVQHGSICENPLLMGLSLLQGSAGSLWSGLSEIMDDDLSHLLLLRV